MRLRLAVGAAALLLSTWAGCGTTKWTDTARTATEQLLVTDSIDRAVSRLDFRALAGKKIFVDDAPIKQATDNAYLVSAVRQHALACGAILKDKRDEAEYILEVRAGAVGTDRHDLLFGVPATNLPTPLALAGVPSQIPEIPLVKRTDQRGVAKISVFAYNRETGRPVWQSGAIPEESKAKAVWVFGAGPFQRGTIYRGTRFAGDRFHIPLIDPMLTKEGQPTSVAVADEAFFVEPKEAPPKPSGPDVAGPSGPRAKDQVAASPAPSPIPEPPPQPAAAAADGQIQRLGEMPAAPSRAVPGPFGPAASPPEGASPLLPDASPASAVTPLPPTDMPPEPPVGDTWLGRRR